jgi:hypothetical protein
MIPLEPYQLNVCHLQAHVSYLVSQMSEHVFSELVWQVPGLFLMGFVLASFSQLKHDPNTYFYFQMGGLGQSMLDPFPNLEQVQSPVKSTKAILNPQSSLQSLL